MATELKTVSAVGKESMRAAVMEAIAEGWQPYDRVLNAGATTIGLVMAKGTNAQIYDVLVIKASSRNELIKMMSKSINDGWEMFGQPSSNSGRFIALMTKGLQDGDKGGGSPGPQGERGRMALKVRKAQLVSRAKMAIKVSVEQLARKVLQVNKD